MPSIVFISAITACRGVVTRALLFNAVHVAIVTLFTYSFNSWYALNMSIT